MQQHGSSRFWAIAGTAAVLGGAAIAAVAAAAVSVIMARTVVTPPRKREEDIRVLAVTDGTVTLSRTLDSLTPGRYSLWFGGSAGHARIGDITEMDDFSVTRELLAVDFGRLAAPSRARMSGWFYVGPRELGFEYEDVEIATTLGMAPAWLVPAASDTGRWVIQVHGRAVRREEALRAVPVFREAGYSSLLISYRNDGDAPQTGDNRYALGDAEWLDVDAAIRFAISRGATDVLLMGWSMGGATVLQAATRSGYAELIRGIVLDSPVIDWVGVLEFQGTVMHVPRLLRRGAMALISQGWGRRLTGQAESIDLARLDFVKRSGDLRWPILLLHSDDDGYVPADGSRALAEARPDIVAFERFAVARHTKLWNYDAPRWNAAIADWLAALSAREERALPAAASARTARSRRPPAAD
ncbi:alpha/beta hydrolase [Glaciihabitans arcticus]|uniref:Alpha/beta hydrolase n=1 Tax=Glaciihabitans arcticus TaxID=2668039 RepID=A0A4Q9GPS3_9MICO|nr:prolyl oligopeptidase family serine peptidase [Glaciihabitans arcticus]TBN56806.1 alpha/beta hydrolase [Glaciihabitans arcticus]